MMEQHFLLTRFSPCHVQNLTQHADKTATIVATVFYCVYKHSTVMEMEKPVLNLRKISRNVSRSLLLEGLGWAASQRWPNGWRHVRVIIKHSVVSPSEIGSIFAPNNVWKLKRMDRCRYYWIDRYL